VTRQSSNRASLNWQAVSTNRNPSAGHYMSNQQSVGIMLAKLGRDASAAVRISHLLFFFIGTFFQLSHFFFNGTCIVSYTTLQAAARRVNSNRKNVEIESTGVAGKFSPQQSIKKYFRMEVPLTSFNIIC